MRTIVLSLVGALLMVNLARAGSPESHEASAQVPRWLVGVWGRDWIQRGKVKSNTLDVHYLQTPIYFADIRIPKDRSEISAARSFADLSDPQLKLLAAQSGFTGLATVVGEVATWRHDIEFQPSDGTADQGRLQQIPPDRMHEHGLDGSYTESWKSKDGGQGRFLVIRTEQAGRLLRTLVVVGNQFVYVRNRARDLPMAPSFDALIEATHATRAQIEEYLDCEFSVGEVRGRSGSWVIEQSTLPWRQGRHLNFVDEVSVDASGTGLHPRAANDENWTVPVNTFSSSEIKAFFRRIKQR